LKRIFLAGLFLLPGSWQLAAREYREVPELTAIFQSYGVEGTFVLLDASNDAAYVSNRARAEQRFVPASTFKIANTIIGLDTGAVKDVDEILPYGGRPQPFKAWEKDMGLREAIKVSNVAIYQELARRIGIDRMREGVRKLGYGNMEIGDVVDRFWLRGPLKISAVEQTEFLERVAEGKLPVKADAVRSVKEITLLEKTDNYELHGKTGWLFDEHLGWFVGWVARDGKMYPFALNIDLKSDKDTEKRIPIARDCLKALGKG
jgi:beta-lactamase class D